MGAIFRSPRWIILSTERRPQVLASWSASVQRTPLVVLGSDECTDAFFSQPLSNEGNPPEDALAVYQTATGYDDLNLEAIK